MTHTKTQDEIIFNTVAPNRHLRTIGLAMDEYAQQQSIGFAEWISNGLWHRTYESKPYWVNNNHDGKTTTELYAIFLNHQV